MPKKGKINPNNYYHINNNNYPRVSYVLEMIAKPGLMNWFKNSKASDIKKTQAVALDIGKKAHKLAERISKGELIKLSEIREIKKIPQLYNCLVSFCKWKNEENIEFLDAEKKVWSDKHCYAGTLDGIARRKGSKALILVDYKSSKAIYDEYPLQAIAYKVAYEERTGEKIDEVWIIRFGKEDGKLEAKLIPNDKHDYLFSVFMAAYQLFLWKYKKVLRRKILIKGKENSVDFRPGMIIECGDPCDVEYGEVYLDDAKNN